jgi:hypothetical protein
MSDNDRHTSLSYTPLYGNRNTVCLYTRHSCPDSTNKQAFRFLAYSGLEDTETHVSFDLDRQIFGISIQLAAYSPNEKEIFSLYCAQLE